MSEYLSVQGGTRLAGRVQVSGAKNAALPLLIATLLTDESCSIQNVPDLDDISVTLRLLKSLGAQVEFAGSEVCIKTPEILSVETPYSLVKVLRASFWVLGPLLARQREARVALPGGDAIGTRPVDLHLKGLAKMGAEIGMRRGMVIAHAPGGLRGCEINLEYPSVGATHQLLMAASLIPEAIVLRGAAREPEIVDLCLFLSAMGVSIEGAGTDVIRILGREKLRGVSHKVLGDRIEAATYAVAGIITQGDVEVSGIDPGELRSTLDLLERAGALIERGPDTIRAGASRRVRAQVFETAPYPGVATDVQPLLMALFSLAEGTSKITETVFENRFGHVAEYRRLGAQISVDGRTAAVTGVERLSGAPVEALDIRAAAGLVLMGLAAEGTTDIYDIHHLDRGYEALVEKLVNLGAKIERSPFTEKRDLVYGC